MLASEAEGLSGKEAALRLATQGLNRFDQVEPTPALRIFVAQFRSVVVLLLVAAALVSLALGDWLESAAISIVLAINTLVGFAIELRATRVMDALLAYEAPSARVRRDGHWQVVSAALLVPGDIIQLEDGDAIPADSRLLEGSGLEVDEAPLTGESIPVDKRDDVVLDDGTILAERANMLFAGTSVSRGRGTAVVVATGNDTELGHIGALLRQVDTGKTPLEVRLDALGQRLVVLALAVAALVTAIGVARGSEWGLMVETGIALAIAAVPEGLPAVATIALAVGLGRMARRRALVRRLSAVESLGATTVVCTDKTGTLTAGHMTVSTVVTFGRTVRVTGDGYEPEGDFTEHADALSPAADPWLVRLLSACALTSRASLGDGDSVPVGDPTDAALLVVARKGGIDHEKLVAGAPRQSEVPFSTASRASVSVHRIAGREVAFFKGAPRVLLDRCVTWWNFDQESVLDPSVRERLGALNAELAQEGLRVIALASGASPESNDLCFLGFTGIVDPPAEGVEEAVEILHKAGVRTVMITGDQRATAQAIATRLGIETAGRPSLDGSAVTAMGDDELVEAMSNTTVIGRATPHDKLRIVQALQARGEIVAMIGDGVNDAVALKKADVGVAMGKRGTDVARQTADIVLTDDRFLTISAAVEEGRVIYDNIRKFVFYLFSCNTAEVFVLLGAGMVGAPLPLTPLQILWLNLVTDTVPALALALEKAEPGIMSRPPRAPAKAILSLGFARAIGFYALLITASTLGAFAWALRDGDMERAVTVAFLTLALSQLFHLGNARGRGAVIAFRRVRSNPWALAAVPIVIALQLAALSWPPLSRALSTVPLVWQDWVVVTVISAMPAVTGQLLKLRTRSNSLTRT